MDKSFLATHERLHSGELPFKCKLCNESYPTRSDLTKHQKLKHNESRPFACLNCKARFSKCIALKVHQKIHSGKKPYNCPYPSCKKSFIDKGNMKTHFKIHVFINTFI